MYSKWHLRAQTSQLLLFHPKPWRSKSIVRKRGGWSHRMRSANTPEGVGAPEAKPPGDSVLPVSVVQTRRKRSPRAETRVPHRLYAEGEKPNSGLFKSWQGERGVSNQPRESGWPSAVREDQAKPLKDSYILCSLWDSHPELAAKTCPGISYRRQRAFLLCRSFVHPLAHKQSTGWGEELCSQPRTSDGSRLWAQDTHRVRRLPSLPKHEHSGWVLTSSVKDVPVVMTHTPLWEMGSHGMQTFKEVSAAQEWSLGFACSREIL